MRKVSLMFAAAPVAVSTCLVAVWFAPPSGAEPAPTTGTPVASTAAPVDPGDLDPIVSRLSADIAKLGGEVGVSVMTVENSREISSARSTTPVNPASNAKLATAAAALSILGSERRFVTGVYGELDNGHVDSLVLRGRGDPTLTTADLRDLAQQVKVAGVQDVGKIVVDQEFFEGSFVPPAFEQQPNEWAPFRAPTAAVSVERNTITILVRPGLEAKSVATIVAEPVGFVDVETGVRTGKKDSAEKITATVSPSDNRLKVKLSGSVPLGSKPVPITRRVDDPRALAGYMMRAVLRQQGVTVGDPVEVRADGAKTVLATHASSPVSEILPRLGKESDNFTAEMVFLALGAEARDAEGKKAGTKPNASASAQVVSTFLAERRAFDEGSVVKNGSGLFDANRLSPRGITNLLSSVARDPRIAHEFIGHLAIAGADGTLRNRMSKWKDRRAIRAKTGTLAGVVALSGYVLDKNGYPRVAFSFIASGVKGKTSEARDAVDKAAMGIADRVWR